MAGLSRRSVLLAAAAAGIGTGTRTWAQGAAWPHARPIRLLVGYGAGGGVDAMARLLAARLGETLGQQVVVENRAGASGLIAADVVAKSAADGYTLLLAESGMLIARAMNTPMPFDPLAAFTPVAGAFQVPLMIVAHPGFAGHNPRSMIEAFKARPGHYSYASPGVGTVQHLGFEWLKGHTGTFVVHIPYRGAAQILPDVVSGQVPIAVVSATGGLAQVRGGRVKALGLLSPAQIAGLENVPQVSDIVPGFSVAPNLFVLAPAGLAAPTTARLSAAVRAVLDQTSTVQAVAAQGATRQFTPHADLGRALARELAQWTEVVRRQSIAG